MTRTNKLFAIATFIVIVTAFLAVVSFKVLSTAIQLTDVKYAVEDYNSTTVKTDAYTSKIESIEAIRQGLYNSNDVIVKTYCNMPSVLKGIVAILSGAYLLAYMTIVTVVIIELFKWAIREILNPKRRR